MANEIGDVWECAIEWSNGIEKATNVFHRQVTAVTSPQESDLGNELVNDLIGLAETAATNHMGAATEGVCATARRVPPAEPTRVFVSYGAVAPIIGGVSVPAQSAVLMSMYPESGGEIKSGRNYIPFYDSTNEDAGQIAATEEAGLLTDFGKIFLDQIILTAIADMDAVLYRYATDILPPVVVTIIEMILRPVLASQRRRANLHQAFHV